MKDIQYLNLSALAYIDFIDKDKSNSLSKILREPHTMNGGRKGLNLDAPELSTLKEDANPLRSFYQLKYTRNVGCILLTNCHSCTHALPQTAAARDIGVCHAGDAADAE